MTRLTYYNQHLATHEKNFDLPGIESYAFFFKHIYSATIAVVDRTNTITLPLKTHSLFPIPTLRPITESLEDICNERAKEILTRADSLGVTLYVSWSGGIDSTLLLISLLKVASSTQKENIVVLMTEASITENPHFYRDHIRGKLRTDSANSFPYLLGTNAFFLGGEGNDQIFGSDVVGKFIQKFGPSVINAPYSRDTFFTYFNEQAHNPTMVNFYLDLFGKLKAACPIPLSSNFDLLWWINFSLKWQSVFMRVLSYTSPRNRMNVERDYIGVRYDHFYNTEKFQLWSLNNQDKKIKDTWNTYKWPCKDIIYDYTKDADYRDNKLKQGSLYWLLAQRSQFNFIDEKFHLYDSLPREEYYEPDNDFR